MDWGGLGKKIVQMGAPLLGKVVAGPAGSQLGGMLARTVGGDPDDPDDLAQKIEQNPEAALKLQQLQDQHEERLQELEIEKARVAIEEEKVHQQDRASARGAGVERMRITGKADPFQIFLGVSVVSGFLGVVFTILYMVSKGVDLQGTGGQVLLVLLGALATCFVNIVQYQFGSSKGSSEKTAAMERQLMNVGRSPAVG